MTVGGTTNSTPGTRRRKISTASCARSFGTARSSRKFVSTAASVNRGAMGVAIDETHGTGAMGLPLLVGERVGAGAVFGGETRSLGKGALGRSDCFARRHGRNVCQPSRSVKRRLPASCHQSGSGHQNCGAGGPEGV